MTTAKPADWFEVDLNTLQLKRVDLDGWPEGMTSAKSRMKEECLESVVALNLDVLFPNEDLLLVASRSRHWHAVDVLAVDPFGFLRLMELKKVPVSLDKLQDQVIGYGVNRDHMPAWTSQLAEALLFLPEWIELSIEGFRVNQRTGSLGEKYVRRYFPISSWQEKNRFEKARYLVDSLRAQRGAPQGPSALDNPVVGEIIDRLYHISLTELTRDDPDELVDRILERRWGYKPSVSGTESTMIAPSLSRQEHSTIGLEERGVKFHLIDAELRAVWGERGIGSAILRWQPVRRTVSDFNLQTVMALRGLLQTRDPTVAAFRRDAECRRIYWQEVDFAFLRIEQTDDGNPILVTRADGLTEGLAYLDRKRRRGLRKVRDQLCELGVSQHTTKDELSAAWDPENLQPALELTAAYHDLLRDAGFFDLVKYAWAKRPAGG